MKTLIVGGAGYLGSVLTTLLLGRNQCGVTVLDTFAHGNTLGHVAGHPELKLVRGDCRDKALMASLLKDHDVIIPLAAVVGAPACEVDPVAAESINHLAIAGLCSMVSKDQKVIMPNTNSGYGIGEPGVECTEESPLRPISLYGQTKVRAELCVLNAGGVSLRLATLFGMSSRMRLDLLVNDFVYRAVNDRVVVLFESHFKRNYLHVHDAARAFIHAIGAGGGLPNGVYNVGLSDANLSKKELCEAIAKHAPFSFTDAPIGEDPDKRDYVVSNAKIEATGFKPVWSLDDGIRELINGYAMIRDWRYRNA
jgi:nucleoside-diphosphate-sugar epimerase